MRRVLLFLFLASLTAFAQQAVSATPMISDPAKLESKNVPEMQNFSVEKLFATRTVGGSTWSPDAKHLAFISNLGGRDNLWLLPPTGGWPTQLTISDQRQTQPAWSPDGTWIAFTSDHDGDEQWNVFLVSPKTGDVLNLTTSPETAEKDPAWTPDERQIAFVSKPKVAASFEVELMDIATRHVRHLTKDSPKELSNGHPIVSRNGKFLVYTQNHASGRDSNVFLVDLATGQSKNLTPHEGEHNYSARDVSPDGNTILITSDAENDFDNVGLLNIATRHIEWLTTNRSTIQAGAFSPDGKSLTWTVTTNGTSEIYLYEIAAKRAQPLQAAAGVNSLGENPLPFTRDGTKLLYYHGGPTTPGDLWTYDLGSRQSQQLTHSLMAGVRPSDMAMPYLVRYPGADGKQQISALVYVPNNIQRNAKFPAIVYLRDRPASLATPSFDPFIQYIVNQGYLVIAPDYRGSPGFGRRSADVSRTDSGDGDVNDVIDAAEWIKKSGFVDPKKLIVMGSGYGGYLSLMALAKVPDMWAAGVTFNPVVNWSTQIANEDPAGREYTLASMEAPATNKALYDERSPINQVDRIKSALLVIATSNDPRYPSEESQQLVDAMKKRGATLQFKLYDKEGHGLSRVEDQIDAYQRVSDFLKVRVPSPGCGCSIYE